MTLEIHLGVENLSQLEERAQEYVISEEFEKLAEDIKFQVTLLLDYISNKGIGKVTQKESKYLLDLEIIKPEYQSFFLSAINDPRTQQQIENDFNRATEEIFG